MQQPGPPSKLSRSHSADHIAVRIADPLRAPPLTYGANLADEVDYGGSPDPSPRMSRRATSSSDDSSPDGSTKPTRKDKAAVDETATARRPKGVILVSEAFTEINAGLVIVLASGHESPVPVTALKDSDADPDEIAHVITSAYHRHVEATLLLHIHLQTLSKQSLVDYLVLLCLARPLVLLQIGAMRGAY